MERARRTASTASSRRRTNPASDSPQSTPESIPEHLPSASPALSNDIKSPQSAPPARRSSKTLQHSSSFSAPGSSRSVHPRKRSKTMDEYGFEYGAEDNDSPRKGGHTLRRRARVDYTFEQIDDDVVVPSSTSSTRTRKRRSDNSYDSEEINAQDIGRRRASLDAADTPSSRRRNPARKSSSEIATYIEAEDEENDVQDTIEVVRSLSDDEHSTSAAASHSSATGENSLPQKPRHAVSASPDNAAASASADKAEDSAEPSKVPESESQDDDAEKPDNQLLQEAGVTATETPSKEPEQVDVQDIKGINGADAAEESKEAVDTEESKEQASAPTKEEPADEQDVLDMAAEADTAMASPKADADADAENDIQKKDDESLPAVEKEDSQDAEPSSPSLQLQKQLDGSPDDAASDSKEALDDDRDEVAKDNTDEAKDEPMEDEPQAESVEKSDTPTAAASEIGDAPASSVADPDVAMEDVPPTKTEIESLARKTLAPSAVVVSKPQPTPIGRWSHLTPYMDGEYVTYPEKKEATPDEDTPAEEPTPEDKDADKDSNGMEPMVEDNDDAPEASQTEAATPALNTPTRGSPVPESMEPTASNSPAPAADEGDDGDVSDSEDVEVRRFFRYRKLRDPEEYISAVENYEDMSTTELFELLEAINVSLVQWQTEWTGLGKVVDDYENSLRRRLADSKYESRTRNLHQHGINYEEPEFVVKGYKAKEREVMSETRYLQGQDRIMAAAYGFEYDPHPSKIGRQNPETQQVGIMTRGRSLRNQPRQTAKATETDEVTGKRTRKPVQLFDPAAPDVSRSSTPVPTRTRRRRNGNGEDEALASSFNGDANSDVEEPPSRTRRRRGGRPQTSAPIENDLAASQDIAQDTGIDEPPRPSRRGRHRAAPRYDDYPEQQEHVEDDQQQKQPKRHLLTLKIPRGKNFSEPSSAITDNGDSRPSTASSESSSHTAESSYSFRPKRQKRFRDEQEEAEAAGQGPPKKRGRRAPDDAASLTSIPAAEATPSAVRKTPKIKVVRAAQASRTGTPSSVGGDADEPRKDYKLMTKSEKMSASMKSTKHVVT